ncbi:hypothetical protein [Chromobacterium sp. CV08]|uniref:hypothetical protein n=1 Tax=Chromobacterium sp. CV08 TaxID=3133274 RepID=UPI003DA95C9E
MNQHDWQPLSGEFLTKGPGEAFNFAIASAEQRAELPPAWPWTLLTPKGFEDNEGLMPSLLDLSALSPENRHALFAQLENAQLAEEPAPLSVLLHADSPPAAMARHLCHTQLLVRQGQKLWLRIFDGRVWSQLPRVLNNRALIELYGPILRWATNLYGRWALTTPPKPGSGTPPAVAWDGLLRIGAVNRAFAQTDRLAWEDAVNLAGRVDGLVQRAQHLYHLARLEDQVAFACYGIRYGEHFDTYPEVQREIVGFMAQSPEEREDSTVVDCLAMLTDEQWAATQAAPIQ